MGRWLRRLLRLAGLLVALVVLAALVGWRLPKEHRVERRLDLPLPQEEVWETITDLRGSAAWRPDVESVRQIEVREGKPVYRERGRFGEVFYEVEDLVPPRRMVLHVVDNDQLGGRWTFRLEATEEGSRLRLAEDSVIYSPLMRFMVRFFYGYEGTVKRYLEALEEHLVPAAEAPPAAGAEEPPTSAGDAADGPQLPEQPADAAHP